MDNAEESRRREADDGTVAWREWGPYLAERQWGTVREDESPDGEAWSSFTHDQSRSRAYRWGEDGLLGISDDRQRLCFALALWNGQDPIVKERLFGLTNDEGNHGEDVKEYYHFVDNTPTHSYMKALYRYPQAAYPYLDLITTNAARSRSEPEYELIDTGVFEGNRHFDVEIEYAKAGPDDICIRITAHNRGPDAATLHLLPTLWFRNTWWRGGTHPELWDATDAGSSGSAGGTRITAHHDEAGEWVLASDGTPELLFTGNETNTERLYGSPNATPYVKDAINEAVVQGRPELCDPDRRGTRVAVHHVAEVAPGSSWSVDLRLARALPAECFGEDFDRVLSARISEADTFYEQITPKTVSADAASVMRQALASMLWSKQFYDYDLDRWLTDRNLHPLRDELPPGDDSDPVRRNARWSHMVHADIISMPDTWEYPWYASWDLAFHTMVLSMVDAPFARDQLRLLLSERYLHPNGQTPAYEWNFGDVNPPVHALATLFSYGTGSETGVTPDREFLEDSFLKLVMNFTWWVNRKDPAGANVFEGGFLGLDNIGVFDRSKPLPGGGRLDQADGTAWMALYSQNMLEIALELAKDDPAYEGLALKFIEHFFYIAGSLERIGGDAASMWDDEDGFFYDLLRRPDGTAYRMKVCSMVGLLPFCAVTVVGEGVLDRIPGGTALVRRFLDRHPDLLADIAHPLEPGVDGRQIFTVLDEDRLRRVLSRLLDPDELLGEFGIRSLSKRHRDHPYALELDGERFEVGYLPAESDSGMFGGNSNWRGPIWMPVNLLIIRALLQYYRYYGDDFTVEHPTGSGRQQTLFAIAEDLAGRLVSIFLRGDDGRRPVFGGTEQFQTDEHWRDQVLFYEYFHGDNGAGLGASHQTGWTGLVAKLIQLFGHLEAGEVLASDDAHPMARLYRRP